MEGCQNVRKIGFPGIKTELLDRPFNSKYLIKYTLLLHLCSHGKKTDHELPAIAQLANDD